MDSQRNILLIALALVSFLLFQQWQVAKNPAPQAVEQAQSGNTTVPAPSITDEFDPAPPQTSAVAKTITVTSDVLTLSIDLIVILLLNISVLFISHLILLYKII